MMMHAMRDHRRSRPIVRGGILNSARWKTKDAERSTNQTWIGGRVNGSHWIVTLGVRVVGFLLALLLLSAGDRCWAQQRASSPSPSGVIIDRLVALVNDDPITESDILWFLALAPDVPEGPFTDRMKQQALEQYIDRQLLYQEAQKLPTIEVTPEAVAQYIADLTKQFPSESAFRRRLQAVGLDEATLNRIVRRRLIILQFIDFRFRAFVLISDEEVQSYYRHRVVPLAEERGQSPPPLEEVRELIEKNLLEEKVASEMTLWFEEARRRADIVYLVNYSGPTRSPGLRDRGFAVGERSTERRRTDRRLIDHRRRSAIMKRIEER